MEEDSMLELGKGYDEYVEAVPDSSLIAVEMSLPGKQVSRVKKICLENGWNLGQGLRILLSEKIREEMKDGEF